jgi:hypothetical protein
MSIAADGVTLLKSNGYDVIPNVIVDRDGGKYEALYPVR